MNQLATVLENSELTLAASVGGPLSEVELSNMTRIIDVAELRADLFPSSDASYLAAQAQRLGETPVLLTIRHAPERGKWAGTPVQRLALIDALLDDVDGVDIELAASILPEVVNMAADRDKVVVVSSHNFEGTPEIDELERKLATAQAATAEHTALTYTKFATNIKDDEDIIRLTNFTRQHRGDNVIAVSMDMYSLVSRVLLLEVGSRLTYGSATNKAAAPGQPTYQALAALLGRY